MDLNSQKSLSNAYKKVAVIGLGGIGSWFMFFINDLIDHKQISSNYLFYLIDDDIVEDKNIFYQYYRDYEIFDPKAEALATFLGKSTCVAEVGRITEMSQLDKFDIIISCVDNNEFRDKFYEYIITQPEKYWMEMRSEGSNFMLQQSHPGQTLQLLKDTISLTEGGQTSCQFAYDLARQQIQQGNKIVAAIGSQWFLEHIRGLPPIRMKYIAAM